MRAVVVGAGIMGLSAARALVAGGAQVTVLEQGPVPNPLGSSVDEHRLIRHPYGASRGYTRMVTEAHAAWDGLWEDLGERHMRTIGTLAVGPAGARFVSDSAAVMAEQGVAFRMLDAWEIARDYPFVRTDGIAEALYAPGGAMLFAEAIVAALARYLRARGVEVRQNTAVREVDPARAEASLADGHVVAGDALVLAAGPWTNRLLPAMSARMTPSRQAVVYVRPPADLLAAWARAPMVLDIDPDAGLYVVPPRAGRGLKVGDHTFSLAGEPDREREPRRDEIEPILALARRRLARFDEYVLDSASTCFYDVSPEERFVVEEIAPRAWALTGFSGHGFKFAPLIGTRVADAILGRAAPAAVQRWAAGGA